MSSTLERIAVVSSNVVNLSTLLNVTDEQEFLGQFMSPEEIQECINGGATNVARVQLLCEKVVGQIMAGSTVLYDALCEYLLKRSEACKSLYQQFTAIECNNNASVQLLFLQEKVKNLTEELLNWNRSHSSCDCQSQSEYNTIKELFAKVETEIIRKRNVQFAYKGLCPVESNASDGSYEQVHWLENDSLHIWDKIVRKEYSNAQFPFPPFVLNEDFVDEVPIVMYAYRYGSEFIFCGGFHPKVPRSVLPVQLQMHLTLTVTKKDNTQWTVDKQIVTAVRHHELGERTHWPLLFTLYDVPFDSFSSTSAPVATNISIKKISPDQKWFSCGLAPRFSESGKFNTIDCNFLNGAEDGTKEWKKMLEIGYGGIHLPALVLPVDIVEDAAVCVLLCREKRSFEISATWHEFSSNAAKSRRMRIKMHLQVATLDNSMVSELKEIENKEVTANFDKEYCDLFTFHHFPWQSLSPAKAPIVCISILPAN